MLPGLALAPSLGGGTNIAVLYNSTSSQSWGTVNNITIDMPSGIANGDLLVMLLVTQGTNHNPNSGISGVWTQDAISVAADNSYRVYHRVASSEPADRSIGWNTSAAGAAMIVSYKNVIGVDAIGTVTKQGASATSTASQITMTQPGALIGCFAAEQVRTVSSVPSGMTQRGYVSNGSNMNLAICDKLTGAGATGFQSLVWSGVADTACSLISIY